MKRTVIMKKLAALLALAFVSVNAYSQGFYVYTKDGQRQDYSQENVDSIVFYEKSAITTIPTGEAIDLGLSVKWASCNVGANSPEEYGGYYAWGETEEKSSYFWEDYKYFNSSTAGNFDYIGSNISATQYDVAHVKWGGSWRMPTLDEIKELSNVCTWKWTTYNGVNGQLVTGPNGNSIFLPAAGYGYGSEIHDCGLHGEYCSATLYEYGSNDAFGLYFDVRGSYWDGRFTRNHGRTVRPVTK